MIAKERDLTDTEIRQLIEKNERLTRKYGEAAHAYIEARKKLTDIEKAVAALQMEAMTATERIKASAQEMDNYSSIIFGDNGVHDSSFAELFRRFELMYGEGADKAARLFGYTSSATLFWKNGTGLPKYSTWESVASIIEEETCGLMKKEEILTILANDRKQKKDAESTAPSAEADDRPLCIPGLDDEASDTKPDAKATDSDGAEETADSAGKDTEASDAVPAEDSVKDAALSDSAGAVTPAEKDEDADSLLPEDIIHADKEDDDDFDPFSEEGIRL